MRAFEALVYFNLGICLATLLHSPQWWSAASGLLAALFGVAVWVTRRAPRSNFLEKLREPSAREGVPPNRWGDRDFHPCAREGCPMYTRGELCRQCSRG